MTTYLISRPGRPLHLALWDRTHGWRPLCGQDYGHAWRTTGPWREDWAKHVANHGLGRGYVCAACRKQAKKLYSAMLIEAGDD